MADSCIYLDTYVVQQDMRIRLPKAVLSNLNVKKEKQNLIYIWIQKISRWFLEFTMKMEVRNDG